MRIGEAVAILVGFLCIHWVWPAANPMQIERTPGHAAALIAQLNQKQPRLVVVGPEEYIDTFASSFLEDASVLALPSARLASAWWYLILKNALVKMDTPPDMFVIFYAGVDPTLPEKRTFAPADRRVLDALATDRERLLDRLAYHERMDPVEFAFSEWSGLYQSRMAVRNRVDSILQDTVARGVGMPSAELRDARGDRFSPPHRDPELQRQHQEERTAARSAYDNRYFDFPEESGQSFLPTMARLANRHGIRLVFIETPSPLRHTREQEVLSGSYRATFRAWLESRGGIHLDMREVPPERRAEAIRAALPPLPPETPQR